MWFNVCVLRQNHVCEELIFLWFAQALLKQVHSAIVFLGVYLVFQAVAKLIKNKSVANINKFTVCCSTVVTILAMKSSVHTLTMKLRC